MIEQMTLKVARNVHWNYQRVVVNNEGHFLDTVALRYNEPRYNEDPVITNNNWKPAELQ